MHAAKTTGMTLWTCETQLGGGFELPLVRFPIPGQQFVDPLCGMIKKFRKDVGKPGLGIDVVQLAGFDQCIDGGGPMPSRVRTCESPVGPANGHTPHGALGCIIAEADAPILQEAGEGGPIVSSIWSRSAAKT